MLAWNITHGSLRSDLVLKDSQIFLYAMLISPLLSQTVRDRFCREKF